MYHNDTKVCPRLLNPIRRTERNVTAYGTSHSSGTIAINSPRRVKDVRFNTAIHAIESDGEPSEERLNDDWEPDI